MDYNKTDISHKLEDVILKLRCSYSWILLVGSQGPTVLEKMSSSEGSMVRWGSPVLGSLTKVNWLSSKSILLSVWRRGFKKSPTYWCILMYIHSLTCALIPTYSYKHIHTHNTETHTHTRLPIPLTPNGTHQSAGLESQRAPPHPSSWRSCYTLKSSRLV